MSTTTSDDAKSVRFGAQPNGSSSPKPEEPIQAVVIDESAVDTALPRSAARQPPRRSAWSRNALASAFPRSESPGAGRRSPSPTKQLLYPVSQEIEPGPGTGRRKSNTRVHNAAVKGLAAVPLNAPGAERQWSGPVDDRWVSTLPMREFQARRSSFRWPTGRGLVDPAQPSFCDFGQNDRNFPLKDKQPVNETHLCEIWSCQIHEDEHGISERVAVKCMKITGGKGHKAWKKERESLVDLEHMHIVALLGTFKYHNRAGIVMYPVAKYDLEHFLELASLPSQPDGLRNLRKRRLRSFLPCLCSALQYLHEEGHIKHRDIKPGNILIDRHASLLIADFGIASKFSSRSDAVTSGEKTQQTNRYAAPEVLKAARDRGLTADIFCLGCVFLEIITVLCNSTIPDLHAAITYEETMDDEDSSDDETIYRGDDRIKRVVRYGADKSRTKVSDYINQLQTNFEQLPRDERFDLVVGHFDAVRRMLSHKPTERPSLEELLSTFRIPNQPCPCHEQSADDNRMHLAPLVEEATGIGQDPSQTEQAPSDGVDIKLVFYDARLQKVSHRTVHEITGPIILVFDQQTGQVSTTKTEQFDWKQLGYFMEAAQVEGRSLETYNSKVRLSAFKILAIRALARNFDFLFVKGDFSKETLEETLERGRRA